jgi:aspartate 4-decarboxylase
MTVSRQEVPSHSPIGLLEFKDQPVRPAKESSPGKSATHKVVDAGRGNPNWVATTAREAFFLLGQFALDESRRVWPEEGVGAMPEAKGSAHRLLAFVARSAPGAGADLLASALAYGTHVLGFKPDAFVHELADSILGDNYPDPDRIRSHVERIVHRFLIKEMCNDQPPIGKFNLFATEGGSAAICYVVRSLVANGILKQGDTIALGTPISTPYVEISQLREYGLNVVEIKQSCVEGAGYHTWTYSDSELNKLADARIKVFFTVTPPNPSSLADSAATHERLRSLVTNQRPDLIVVADDVYGTFVPDFVSFAHTLPHNTILIYSFSKYFGCTGWRLGVVAVHEQNVIDRALSEQSATQRESARQRYRSITEYPSSLQFIDRMVADSRELALNHTAGLAPPQQVQMALFSLFALMDPKNAYKQRCCLVLRERLHRLEQGLGHHFPEDALRAGYYVDLDLAVWGQKVAGSEFLAYVQSHHAPIDIVLALARRHGTVLLNGGGFDGPSWSVRISLASLHGNDYEELGRDLADLCRRALAAWKSAPIVD